MKIVVASDHGGFDHKEKIKEYLMSLNHEVIDVGTYNKDSCNYPEFAKKACQKLVDKEVSRAILICTTGEGIMMTANRFKGVRCGIGYDDEVVSLMRRHNDANAIAFGEKFMNIDDCIRRINIFLNTNFEGGRHSNRVNMIENN